MLPPSSYISKHRLNELCVVTKCHTHNDPTNKKKKKEVEKCNTHSYRDSLVQRKDDYSCFKSDRGLYHHPSEWALLLCLKNLKNAQDISSRAETASLRHTELSQTLQLYSCTCRCSAATLTDRDEAVLFCSFGWLVTVVCVNSSACSTLNPCVWSYWGQLGS